MSVSIKIIDVDIRIGRPIFLWTHNILGRGEILLKNKNNIKKNLECFENEDIYVILLKYRSNLKQVSIEEGKKQYKLYELYKNLNPKYSEEIMSLNEAKLKIHSSDIVNSTKFNLFGNY